MEHQKRNRILRIVGSILTSLIILIFFLGIVLSPYGNHDGHEYKLVKESVLINAPANQIYQFLGNSENAREWSTYLHHITTLNDHEVADGQLGSIRRCFVNENEEGQKWDEEILIVESNNRRQLSCYNFVGFEVSAGPVGTEQLYEETENGSCLLSFTLFLPPGESSLLKELKMYFGSYIVAHVFNKNLQNIKKLNEENARLPNTTR